MSAKQIETVLESVLRAWVHDVEMAIRSAEQCGMSNYNDACLWGGALTNIPIGISVSDLKLEILPEIKETLGL